MKTETVLEFAKDTEYLYDFLEILFDGVDSIQENDFSSDYGKYEGDYIQDKMIEFADGNCDNRKKDLLSWLSNNYEYLEDAIDKNLIYTGKKFNLMCAIQRAQFLQRSEDLQKEWAECIDFMKEEFSI